MSRRTQRCSYCSREGHNIRTCPKKERDEAMTRKKRQQRCSYCRTSGHNVRSCPKKEREEEAFKKRQRAAQKKEAAAAAARRKRQRDEEAAQERRRQQEAAAAARKQRQRNEEAARRQRQQETDAAARKKPQQQYPSARSSPRQKPQKCSRCTQSGHNVRTCPCPDGVSAAASSEAAPALAFRTAPRSKLEVGRTKRGSAEQKTDAAHKLSFEVAKAIKSHSAGRPVTKGMRAMARALNRDSNLRIKSRRGNRITDRINDKRIIEAYVKGEVLPSQKVVGRAIQAYRGGNASRDNPSVAHVTDEIGKLVFRGYQIKDLARNRNWRQLFAQQPVRPTNPSVAAHPSSVSVVSEISSEHSPVVFRNDFHRPTFSRDVDVSDPVFVGKIRPTGDESSRGERGSLLSASASTSFRVHEPALQAVFPSQPVPRAPASPPIQRYAYPPPMPMPQLRVQYGYAAPQMVAQQRVYAASPVPVIRQQYEPVIAGDSSGDDRCNKILKRTCCYGCVGGLLSFGICCIPGMLLGCIVGTCED